MKDREAGFSDAEVVDQHLQRVLSVKDLTLMGIAAVVGAGIAYSSLRRAAHDRRVADGR